MHLTLPRAAHRLQLQPYPLAVAGLIAAGVLLRLYGLSAHYLSYDETFTFLAAERSLADMIRATAGDVHPPASYLLTWLFTRLAGGFNPITLRLPSVILGCSALPMLVALAGRLNLSRPAILAGLALFAFSPFQIHYSQDGRMYPLLQVAVLGALMAVWDRKPLALGAWLTLAVYTHNYGLFYLAVIGLVALGRELREPVFVDRAAGGVTLMQPYANLRGVMLALIVPLLLWSPWAAALVYQMRALSTGYWILPLSLGQALYPLYTLAWGVSMPARLAGPAALVVYGAVAFAAVKALRLRQQRVLLWLIVGPAMLAAGVSLASTPIYLFRAFIGVAAPLCLLIGWAITERVRWPLTAWALAMIGPLALIAVTNRIPALHIATGENSRALEVVQAGWQPGDVVYHGNVGTLSGFLATAPDAMPNFLMTVQPGSVGVLTPETRAAMGFCEGELRPGVVAANCGYEPVSYPWRRAWLVWGASQTISGAEDAAIAALLAAYPNEQVLAIRDVYHGPMPVEGGIWLLTNR